MDAPSNAAAGREDVCSRLQHKATRGNRRKWRGSDVCPFPCATWIRKITLLSLLSKAAELMLLTRQQRTAGVSPVDGFTVVFALGGDQPDMNGAPPYLKQNFRAANLSPMPSPTSGEYVICSRRCILPRRKPPLHSLWADAFARHFVQPPSKQAPPRPHDTFAQLFHSRAATASPLPLPAPAFVGLKTRQHSREVGEVSFAYPPHTLDNVTAVTGTARSNIQAEDSDLVETLNPSSSDPYQVSGGTHRPPSQGNKVSPGSSGVAIAGGSVLEKSQKVTLSLSKQAKQAYKSEDALKSKIQHSHATTEPPCVETALSTHKRRRFTALQPKSSVQVDGLLQLGDRETGLGFRTQSQARALGVHPSDCRSETREAKDKQSTTVPLRSSSAVPRLRVEIRAGKRLEPEPISHVDNCQNASRELGDNERRKETDQGTRRQLGQLQQQRRKQRRQLPLSEVDIGSTSFLGSSTEAKQDDGEDEGDDGEDGDDDDRGEDEGGEGDEDDHSSEEESPSSSPPPKKRKKGKRLFIPTPFGIAARVVGGIAKSILGR